MTIKFKGEHAKDYDELARKYAGMGPDQIPIQPFAFILAITEYTGAEPAAVFRRYTELVEQTKATIYDL